MISTHMKTELVDGLRTKGINRTDAVFLVEALVIGYESDRLLEQVGTFGMERLREALANLCAAGVA